ncbi:phage tail tape measure protein [Intestinimonas butyriciproducens]|uniref:TP901 family phage tail tape measure protein n=1 Tax=Intestinimonas butyriciproducens TaxID=1297617 RepID=A0A2U1CFF5_9FIRM|nr:phage tail tape measure protein [Intestinimonas butyriciproducens]MCR1904907.1 phage tail tape measure protein [Intestinimonas butyriciproducens]PVY59649.1 TP901 family phage tail tape measure protein [Intestinimonas butyriciproducens]QBB64739.1 Phage tail length tape-measure protein [Intestinimonas butyriciproducens]
MAGDKTLKLSIWIAGHMDKSLTAAISSANGQISSLSQNMSRMGTVGLAAMGALAAGTVVALGKCTKEAESFEKSMADVVKYVDGLADKTGKISNNIWGAADGGNGRTFQQNYKEMSNALLDLSTQIPMTAEDLTKLAAAAGQSGKSMSDLIAYDSNGNIGGFLKDVAMVGTAMDITADQAGNWAAKWEKSLNMTHEQVMVLFDQINYLGANSATTAAEIAEVVNSAASLGDIAGMDAASTAALADAMLAMGVDSSVASTSISRMLVNMSKGESATKKQKEAWAELGLTASGVARAMQTDATGTMLDVLERIGNMDASRQVATLNTLFGQWAIKGAAKLTGNLSTFTDALKMVSDPALYGGSMEREFIIKASTSDAIDTMMKNSFDALKIDIGTQFLPVKKEFSLMMIDTMNGLRKNMPELTALATSAAKLLSNGVASAGEALKTAMPYIQQALDYLVNNGDKVIKVIEGIGAAFLGMKFAPQIEGAARGIGTLLTGKGGMGSLFAGGAGQEKGRKLGGLLGGVKNLFTGGQSAAAAGAGAISAFSGAAGSNGLRATLGATLSSLISGNGLRGTTGLLQTAAGTPGLLSGYQSIGSILGGTRAGQYLGGIGSSLGNLGSVIGGTKPGQFLGGLLNKAGGFIGGKAAAAKSGIGGLLSAATLPLRKGIAGIGASAIINGNILANSKGGQLAGGLLRGSAGLMGSIWGPIAGGFGSLLAGAAPVVGAISGIIAVVSILGDHLEDIRGIVGNVFGEKGLVIFDTFTDKIKGVGQFISGLFQEGGVANALAPLREMFSGALGKGGLLSTIFGGQENGLAAFDGVVQIIQSVMGVVGQLVSFSVNTVQPIIERAFTFITQTVLPTIVTMFASAAPTIASIISGIGSAVMTGMQLIGSAIQTAMPIIEAIIQIILNIGSVAIPAVLSAFSVFAQGISALMANIKGIFDGLISFITGVFTGNWQQAWDGIKQVFGNAFDALVTLCKTPINAVISLINSAISGINKLGLTIPDWVPLIGGKSFSINIPEIPMLARGGFTAGPSIAGEAGREAVISFKSSERARNISLWEQAGRMLGVNAVKLDEIERDDQGWGAYPGGESMTFAPQIIIQGNADASVMEQAIAEMRSQFEEWYEQMQHRRMRTAY